MHLEHVRAFVESRLILRISLGLIRRETQIPQRRSLRIRGGLRFRRRTLSLIQRLGIGIESEIERREGIGYRVCEGTTHGQGCWVEGAIRENSIVCVAPSGGIILRLPWW